VRFLDIERSFFRRERFVPGTPVAARVTDLPGAVNLLPAFGIDSNSSAMRRLRKARRAEGGKYTARRAFQRRRE
jgi:hypothetical protein